MMKTKQHNNVIDHTNTIYVENEIKVRWLIILGMIYE